MGTAEARDGEESIWSEGSEDWPPSTGRLAQAGPGLNWETGESTNNKTDRGGRTSRAWTQGKPGEERKELGNVVSIPLQLTEKLGNRPGDKILGDPGRRHVHRRDTGWANTSQYAQLPTTTHTTTHTHPLLHTYVHTKTYKHHTHPYTHHTTHIQTPHTHTTLHCTRTYSAYTHTPSHTSHTTSHTQTITYHTPPAPKHIHTHHTIPTHHSYVHTSYMYTHTHPTSCYTHTVKETLCRAARVTPLLDGLPRPGILHRQESWSYLDIWSTPGATWGMSALKGKSSHQGPHRSWSCRPAGPRHQRAWNT